MTSKRFWNRAEFITLIVVAAPIFLITSVSALLLLPLAFVVDVMKMLLSAVMKRVQRVNAIYLLAGR